MSDPAIDLRPLDELFAEAAARKGGADAFEASLPAPASAEELAQVPDDRWLAGMTRSVFQAGFNWKVIDAKWPRFEEVFEGFDVGRMALMSDDDVDRYLKAEGIVRHAKKLLSIRENAAFLQGFETERGRRGAAIARWPADDFAGLLWTLKQRGSRLGGTTGMYFLRGMRVDGFVLSRDVVRALMRERVLQKEATSKRDLDAVQKAFDAWRAASGRPLTHISRILACSIE